MIPARDERELTIARGGAGEDGSAGGCFSRGDIHRNRGRAGDREHLVSARNGNIGQIDYTAAKGPIEAFTRTTAREFAADGARLNAISPGPVDPPMPAGVDDRGSRDPESMAGPTLRRNHSKAA